DCKMLQAFFDASPQGVLVIHEGEIVYINQTFCKTMAVTPEIAVNQRIELLADVLSPDQREHALEGFSSLALRKKSSDKKRYHFTNRLGETYVIEITANSVQIGDKLYVIAYGEDVTSDEETRENAARERKAYGIIAEAALSTEDTAHVCDKVLSGLIENLGYDIGTIRFVNPEDQTLELISAIGFDEEPPEPSVAIDDPNKLSARTARTKQPLFIQDFSKVSKDLERMAKPQQLGLNSLIFWPIIGSDDSILGVINVASRTTKSIGQIDRGFFATVAGMFSTILERRKTEEQLKESQDQFIAFADNMPGPVFIKNHQSRVVFTNRFMRMATPIPGSGEKSIVEVFGEKRAKELEIEDQKILARGPIERIQESRDMEGKIRTYRSHKFPIFREGKPPLIGGFSTDITERVEAEKQHEEARARAEFFNDLMAHDINNMHQGIMASLELIIEDEGLPERLRDLANRALMQVNRSVSLISNVKKFSMINKGDIQLERTDIAETLIVSIETVKQSFPSRKINVKTNVSKGKYCIMANEFLQDVFYNLLHNAVKVTPTEDVEIDVKVSINQDGEFLKIDFVDWGTGMDDRMKKIVLTSLGERVQRISGVGLTLVKQIIDQYSGKISIEDRVPGDFTKGARFVVLLPFGC
ncbi:MAG: PAS domain S-box protein, partial [Candidatus Thorarchaeota archaeon]|nr:PAS domain S-box protein [Candidatus Thorarchaeota archaeon]